MGTEDHHSVYSLDEGPSNFDTLNSNRGNSEVTDDLDFIGRYLYVKPIIFSDKGYSKSLFYLARINEFDNEEDDEDDDSDVDTVILNACNSDKIYENAKITAQESTVLLFSYINRHHSTKEATNDLLTLLYQYLPEGVPDTVIPR